MSSEFALCSMNKIKFKDCNHVFCMISIYPVPGFQKNFNLGNLNLNIKRLILSLEKKAYL